MGHINTIFSQLLQLVDRHDFRRIEQKGYQPGRKYRTLGRWEQFVVMMFAQITTRCGLRDIVNQFQFQSSRLYHLGACVVKRSTLADANSNRDAGFFEAIFHHQYKKCASVAPKKRFRFKNKLYSLDASVVDLCLSLFDWAKFRTTKGGIKLHTLLDHDGYIPAFVQVTKAKTADLTVAKVLQLPSGSIVAMDRAYVDFAWFHKLNENKISFVTRMKKNIKYQVVQRHKVLKSKGVTSDQTIILTGTKAKDCPVPLRRVGYRDPETKKHYVYLTNIFRLSSKTIADIYRERWQIELFFKWIKQNLKVKTFFGTTKNAVLTQLWIALITMLLLAYYKFLARLGNSLSQILHLLQLNLFNRRNIWCLFDPGKTKRTSAHQQQLSLNFNHL